MSVTIIKETGSGSDPAANSYGDAAGAATFAANRGVVLGDADTVGIQLIQAMDYIEAKRSEFKGSKTTATQPLQWPRAGAWIDGSCFVDDAIPSDLVFAQYSLVIALFNGIDIQPNNDGLFITQETIGPLTTKYSEAYSQLNSPSLSAVDGYLAPLLNGNGEGRLRTIRI